MFVDCRPDNTTWTLPAHPSGCPGLQFHRVMPVLMIYASSGAHSRPRIDSICPKSTLGDVTGEI